MRKRKYQVSKDAIDTGAPMLRQHFNIVPRFASPDVMVMSVADSTEIDKLLLHDHVNVLEHSTLQTFAKKLQDAGINDLRSPSLEGVGSSDPSLAADKRAHKLRSIVALFKRMDKHAAIGTYRRKKLVNLVLGHASWGDLADLHPCVRALDEIFTRK